MTAKFDKAVVDVIVGEYVAVIDADYEERGEVMKELANRYEVTVPAIRGKLVAEGVYKKKEVEAKTSVKRVDKEALAKALNDFTGLNMTSATNMNAKDLQALWERLVEMSDIRNADEGKK